MRIELELELAKDFPFMRSRESITSQHEEEYEAFYMDCGDGWYNVLRGLCQEIQDAYCERGLEVDFLPTQIKEKFGGLRIYYDGAHKDMHDIVYNIVDKWTDVSYQTCEKCGAQGKVREDRSWLQTLCDQCWKR